MKENVLIFLADGFEEIEALSVVDVLRRAGIDIKMCSIKDKKIRGAHGIEVISDVNIDKINVDLYSAIVLPGGSLGTERLKNCTKLIEIIRRFNSDGKLIAAICAAPIVLSCAGIIKDKNITSYPDVRNEIECKNYTEKEVVKDGNILTSRGPSTAEAFAFEIVKILKGSMVSEKVKKNMLYGMY